MATGQIYMLLGLLSFSLLGVLHKVADVKTSRPSAINALLFSCVAAVRVPVRAVRHADRTGGADARGRRSRIPFGVAASVAILAFQAGLKHGNIATSWLAINLSAGIPTVASILIYDEPVGVGKALALALIPVSMFLLWKDKKAQEGRDQAVVTRDSGVWLRLMLVAFVANGIGPFGLKILTRAGAGDAVSAAVPALLVSWRVRVRDRGDCCAAGLRPYGRRDLAGRADGRVQSARAGVHRAGAVARRARARGLSDHHGRIAVPGGGGGTVVVQGEGRRVRDRRAWCWASSRSSR